MERQLGFHLSNTNLAPSHESSIRRRPSSAGIQSPCTSWCHGRSHIDPKRSALLPKKLMDIYKIGRFCLNVLTQPGGRGWVIGPNSGVHLAFSWSANSSNETKYDALMRLLPSEPKCVEIAESNESRSIIQQRCCFCTARNPCVGDKVP